MNKLKEEYQRLVEGLRKVSQNRITDEVLFNPILPDSLLQEAIPGNIRKAEHFLSFLRRWLEYLKRKLKVMYVTKETPLAFLQDLKELTLIDKKPLK